MNIIQRMENGYQVNIENEKVNTVNGICSEERKLILNKINKFVSYKNTTGNDIVNYISQIADGIKLITA